MENKKQKENWAYSKKGKRLRGLLCIITFVILGLSATAVYDGIITVGWTDMFSKELKSYFSSQRYKNALFNDMTNVLESIATVEEQREYVLFTDVGNKCTYYIDKEKISDYYEEYDSYYDDELQVDMDIINACSVQKENVDLDIMNYSSMKEFLESDLAAEGYLYISEDTFKQIFIKKGIQNENKKFSTEFSEEAYFIFYVTDDSLDKYLKEIKKKKIDLADLSYFVYDPLQNLFYSTWDDSSFVVDGSCIYSYNEVMEKMETSEERAEGVENIIFPLVWSDNYTLDDIMANLEENYEMYESAMSYLDEYEISSFKYWVNYQGKLYKNVDEISEITDCDHSYVLQGALVADDQIAKVGENVTEEWTDWVAFNWDILPEDVAYFAIDLDANDARFYHYTEENKAYSFYLTYGRVAVVWVIIFSILLLVQVVWLIITTGRREKGDKEVELNRYDCLPTEIWFVLTAGILTAGLLTTMVVLAEYAGDYCSMYIAVTGTGMSFGLCFMLLTLSFARRIKAHNLRNRMLLGKMCRQSVQTVKAFIRNRKGTEKLFIAFLGYLVVQILGTMILVDGYEIEGIIVFVIIDLIAACVICMIIKDICGLNEGVAEIIKGNMDYKCKVNPYFSLVSELSDGINHIGDGLKAAVETSLKDERMKTELITNVSHDLKTPLTSIINYVDLLKKEEMKTPEAEHYLEVLDQKSQRLKQLTEDLIEAAKANTGNIELEMMPLAFDELMRQAIGEFEDKFSSRKLTIVTEYPEEAVIVLADGRRMFRILENILQNAYKYAMEGSRIYADLSKKSMAAQFTLKNVSAAQLNITPEELMERFTRGDSSRTTEGSGLGLSIAKDLTALQNGKFDIFLDGDLFKVVVEFPLYSEQ